MLGESSVHDANEGLFYTEHVLAQQVYSQILLAFTLS